MLVASAAALMALASCTREGPELTVEEAPSPAPPPESKALEVEGSEAPALPAVADPEEDLAFPSGTQTPEGAACDMARAFILPDGELYRATCLGMPGNEEYTSFISEMGAQMDAMQGQSMEQFGGPREITKVYRARELSASGPASYGFATMQLQSVQFVDVESVLWDGSVYVNRTLVLQLPSGAWRAMPRPDLVPLLSVGLNSESDSTELWQP
ncbi:MAG: hypothetical protein DHS20C14_18540 [Phycisphaeraceae bacterium]|nr:MAG: hypothetical protein DHS20C14_18540 [Phycisphaeraceae bacterium]